jgi:hypothetical protein
MPSVDIFISSNPCNTESPISSVSQSSGTVFCLRMVSGDGWDFLRLSLLLFETDSVLCECWSECVCVSCFFGLFALCARFFLLFVSVVASEVCSCELEESDSAANWLDMSTAYVNCSGLDSGVLPV